MNVLIIEDDKNKVLQVKNFLIKRYPDIKITDRFSYQSGLMDMYKNDYDVLLLDMSMPTFDISESESGGRYRPFAGLEILSQMDRRGIETPTIVITQFEQFGDLENHISLKELRVKMETEYNDIYMGTVYYNSAENNWMTELENLLSGV
ncbi:hypothetical protein [Enterococcus sp. DIV0187]|uniref:hypothetical protein n=1 Tax=Enterococcus sp. DIV0187 TaxID=2774644 RepID=UPI003F1F7740